MHQFCLFHNDITPRNIMLSEKTGGAAELIDMSHVSKFVGGSPSFDTADLDERYQAGLTFAGLYNNATDLFSAIALFYTMLTNRVPWDVTLPEGISRKEKINIVKEKRKTPLDLSDLDVKDSYKHILENGLRMSGLCKYADADLVLDILQNPDGDYLQSPEQEDNSKQSPDQVGNNSVQEDERQATEAKVEVQKSHGNGFKDIAGMDELKQMLTQKVIFILKDKEKAAKYKLLPPNGMLFYGPLAVARVSLLRSLPKRRALTSCLLRPATWAVFMCMAHRARLPTSLRKRRRASPPLSVSTSLMPSCPIAQTRVQSIRQARSTSS